MRIRKEITPHETIRRRAGLTITELARQTGYSRPHVSRIEGGLQKPSARYRAAVAKALRVPEEFIFGEAHPNGDPGKGTPAVT